VKKSSKLPDSFFTNEIERMSGLPKFPLLPAARLEIRRALRRVSETDGTFIHNLITEAVDADTICPTPAELIRRAGEIRHRAHASVGKADCERCHGSGFIRVTRRVRVAGMEPYEAEFSAMCVCRGGQAA
jgi:hypothetical protein